MISAKDLALPSTRSTIWQKAIKGKYGPAIAELKNSLDVVDDNAPRNKQKGNLPQMRLEITDGKAFRRAINKLVDPNEAIKKTLVGMRS